MFLLELKKFVRNLLVLAAVLSPLLAVSMAHADTNGSDNVTMTVTDAPIKAALKVLFATEGHHLLYTLDPAISGTISIDCKSVPFDDAFWTIIKSATPPLTVETLHGVYEIKPRTAAFSDTPPANPGPAPAALAPAINTFGFHALQTVSAAGGSNVCLSPVSLHLALDMARCGAVGQTAGQMSDTLATAGVSPDLLQAEANALLGSLNAGDPGVTLTVANSLWIDNRTTLLPSFVDACKSSFGADVANLDLRSPASIAKINAWVSDKTHGKIDRILDDSNTGEASILANALYFKGAWQDPFATNLTTNLPFHPGGGKPDITVPMMDRKAFFAYYADSDVQVVQIPFGNGRFAFVVALPKAAAGLASLVDSLDDVKWNTWMAGLTNQSGEVAMPRFKMTYDVTMNAALKKLGMVTAFSREADFSKMVAPPAHLSIDFVKHDTYLSVDENGAEAAAATVVGMSALAIARPIGPSFQLIADHPFLCAIMNTTSGVVLFEGAVYNPG